MRKPKVMKKRYELSILAAYHSMTYSSQQIAWSPSPPPEGKKAPLNKEGHKSIMKNRPTMGRRDAGLAKTHDKKPNATNKSNTKKPQSAIEKLDAHRESKANRMERKHQCDHELQIECEKTKPLKYECKKAAADADRTSRLDELRLQIELACVSAPPPPRPPFSSFNAHIPYDNFASDNFASTSTSCNSGFPSSDNSFDFDSFTDNSIEQMSNQNVFQ
jgi:hypothetical protein